MEWSLHPLFRSFREGEQQPSTPWSTPLGRGSRRQCLIACFSHPTLPPSDYPTLPHGPYHDPTMIPTIVSTLIPTVIPTQIPTIVPTHATYPDPYHDPYPDTYPDTHLDYDYD